MNTSSVTFFNINISNINFYGLENAIKNGLNNSENKLSIACANPHSLVVTRSDNKFKKALQSNDILVADGVGLCIASKWLKRTQLIRITGSDVFRNTMRIANKKRKRVFFFGSSEDVLSKITKKIGNDFPGIQLVGTLSPPFEDWSENKNNEMISSINKLNPDILWVGMTAPKQEKWVYENSDKINAKIIASIGAVFDFYAGSVLRAPKWMCKYGLEWLYRLFNEPRRMFKRNILSTPKFIFLVIYETFISKS